MWQCCALKAVCDAAAQVVCVLQGLEEVAVLVDTRHTKRVVHTADLQAAATQHVLCMSMSMCVVSTGSCLC
jgi:hypothetical protein